MATEFNKQEEPDDSVFPINLEENSHLDMYGVWIKKHPENNVDTAQDDKDTKDIFFDENSHDIIDLNQLEDNDITLPEQDIFEENTTDYSDENDIVDLDGIDGVASMAGIEEFDLESSPSQAEITDDKNEELDILPEFQPITTEDENTDIDYKEKNADMDINEFETLDLDDFLTEETEPVKENEISKEPSDAGIETVTDDIIATEEPHDSLTDFNDSTIEEAPEFNDLLDNLSPVVPSSANDEIDMNITIDEDSDISSIAGKTAEANEDFDDVAIFTETPAPKSVKKTEEPANPADDLVIESTVIEAENINEIREENRRILHGNDKDIFFDDVEAVKNDLFDEPSNPEKPAPKKEKETQINTAMQTAAEPMQALSALHNDKATEILMQIAGELSSIKTELATLKTDLASAKAGIENAENKKKQSGGNAVQETPAKPEEEKDSGFFNDDDGDETIALTGDELNNILITADFTEENAKDEFEVPEVIDMPPEQFNGEKDEAPDTAANKAEPTISSDEPFPDSLETEHITPAPDDLSYLEQDDVPESAGELDGNIEEYTDIPDFTSEKIEEPDLDNFDLTIKELELPNGQSIELGDGVDTKSFTVSEPVDAAEPPETDSLDEIDFMSEETLSSDGEDFEIPEELVIDDSAAAYSAEDLDETTDDIPRLDLETNTAEEHKAGLESSETAAEEIPKTEPVATVQTQPAKTGLGEKAEMILSNSAENKMLPLQLKDEIKSVLTYMDQLLESLPESKIEEFAKSEYFDTYKRLFEELGIS